MAGRQGFHDIGWQGLRLRVPAEWELGRVDGDGKSGYARLDDAEMVRAEVEWRSPPESARRRSVTDLVDRYLQQLEKKAQKARMGFAAQRQARFLRDKRWLEACEYETFTWEADYRAYNLARACPQCQRVVLLRLLAPPGESAEELVNQVFPSLEDHPRPADGGRVFWSVYGLTFHMAAGFALAEHRLRSGHIELTFERDTHTLRVHRLSMAHMLLKGTSLQDWYASFFRKDLRDLRCAVTPGPRRGHEAGLGVAGEPRSRWRQILRPLPLVNPRPRRHLRGAVWHCPEQNRICVVEHLTRKRGEVDDGLLDELIDGYVCHAPQTAPDARGDAQLAPGAQRAAPVGEDRGW